MGNSNITDHETQGDVILDRLATLKTPAALKPAIASFKKVHAAFKVASGVVAGAKSGRDAALQAVATADAALDKAVDALAAKMIGAQMGPRTRPFANYAKLSPSDITGLAYASEVREVLALTAKLRKAKLLPVVAKAASDCDKAAAVVTRALAGLTRPQLAYTKSLAARDTLLLSWTKSLTTLKRKALGEWSDDVATYKSVFASPVAVQAPTSKKSKSSKSSKSKKKLATKKAVVAAPEVVQNGQTAPAQAAPTATKVESSAS